MATKIASLYAEISGDTSKLNKSLSDSKTGLSKFADAFQKTTGLSLGAAGAWGLAASAAKKLGDFIVQSVKETQEYNLAMVDMARKMGTTTEEASRLVQVGDDVRLSQEQISTAMNFAIRNGVEPTIEGLARLADQYNSLGSATERGQFLLHYFGRSGMEMGKLMELGGAGIRDASMAINDNLVVTEKAAKASKEYYQNVDALNDSMLGIKMTIGNELIPVLSDVIPYLTWFVENADIIGGISLLGNAATMGAGLKMLEHGIRRLAEVTDDAAGATNTYTGETGFLKNAMEQTTPTTEDLADATQELASSASQAALALGSEYANALKMSNIKLGMGNGTGMGTQFEDAADQLKYLQSGGMEVQATSNLIMENAGILLDAGYDVNKMLYNMAIADAQSVAKMGGDWKTLAKNIQDQWGGTFKDIKGKIFGAQVDLRGLGGHANFIIDIWKIIHEVNEKPSSGFYNTTAELTAAGIVLGVAGAGSSQNAGKDNSQGDVGYGHATGGSFDVPSGHPTDSFPILAKTGEHVEVTAAGEPQEGIPELIAAIREMPRYIARSVRDAVLQA